MQTPPKQFTSVNILDSIRGKYEGSGNWYDSAGKTMAYRVTHRSQMTGNGFEVKFKHDFDDGSVTNARLVMTWIAPFIFRVDAEGKEVGRGYCIADSCHYYLKAGEAFVEVSYRPTGGGLLVNGSSTRNAEGNYIAWHESLRKTDELPA